MIDLANLQDFHMDKTSWQATFGAGYRLGDLDKKLQANGNRAIAHGTCPGVGIGGHATIVSQLCPRRTPATPPAQRYELVYTDDFFFPGRSRSHVAHVGQRARPRPLGAGRDGRRIDQERERERKLGPLLGAARRGRVVWRHHQVHGQDAPGAGLGGAIHVQDLSRVAGADGARVRGVAGAGRRPEAGPAVLDALHRRASRRGCRRAARWTSSCWTGWAAWRTSPRWSG